VKREPLKPLIPLDELRKVVGGLIAAPKDQTFKANQAAKPKKLPRANKSR
jgi:hypothetical protein